MPLRFKVIRLLLSDLPTSPHEKISVAVWSLLCWFVCLFVCLFILSKHEVHLQKSTDPRYRNDDKLTGELEGVLSEVSLLKFSTKEKWSLCLPPLPKSFRNIYFLSILMLQLVMVKSFHWVVYLLIRFPVVQNLCRTAKTIQIDWSTHNFNSLTSKRS